MHYDYFDFQHTMSDDERVAFLHQSYERIITHLAEGTFRNINRVMKFLRESEFYALPCRHHQFVGGTAWHQLTTLLYAFQQPEAPGWEMADSYREQQPLWLEGDRFGIAIVALLHDVGNAQGVEFPSRIMKRHGRRSTYVIIDKLKFELMFDENMAIIYHQQHTPDDLLHATPDYEAYERIWAMPLYRMVQHCDNLATRYRLTESQLLQGLDKLYSDLGI